jgi:hypothetical protein
VVEAAAAAAPPQHACAQGQGAFPVSQQQQVAGWQAAGQGGRERQAAAPAVLVS